MLHTNVLSTYLGWHLLYHRQCTWRFLGCLDLQWQQSYLGKTRFCVLWSITSTGRGRQLGSFLSCSRCSPSQDAGGQGQTFSTRAVSCSWVCGTPMSWLFHVFVTGKTHIWFQFCSSEGPGRERPGHWGMDVKDIKDDFQLPVEKAQANPHWSQQGSF